MRRPRLLTRLGVGAVVAALSAATVGIPAAAAEASASRSTGGIATGILAAEAIEITALTTGFEDGLGAWGPRGTESAPVVTLSDVARTGASAASVAARGDTWHGLGASVADVFLPATTYELSAWVRLAPGESATDVRLSVQRTVEGADDAYDTVATATGVTPDAWVQVTGTYQALTGSQLLYLETASGTASFLVDDVTVTQRAAPGVQEDIPSLKDVVPWPFGVAIDERETTGASSQLVTKHFGQFTPENQMKPEAIQPTEGEFTFAAADALMDFAVDNDLRVYGHTLVWHSQTPDWFFEKTVTDSEGVETAVPLSTSAEDQAVLRARMRTHIETVAEHFRTTYGEYGTAGNPIVGFDVVNEVIAESEPDGLRRSEWFRVLGPGYIAEAFEIASEAFNGGDPEGPVALFINDYNTELPAKREAMFSVVEDLLAAGAPVDGVGHQLHVSLAQPIGQIKATLDRFAPLGLLQNVSELDVGIDGTITQEKLVEQGYYYADLFDVLRDYDLSSVTVWGPTDTRSWRSEGSPLLFDGQLQAKPAYWGIVDRAQLPTLTLRTNAPEAEAPDATQWALLPDTSISGETGFQLRWSGSTLVTRVVVADATDDGAYDVVTLFGPGGAKTVTRADATDTSADGYEVLVSLPLDTAGEVGAMVPFDVRVADHSGDVRSWNDKSNTQEESGSLGVVTLVEPVSVVAAPAATTAPVIDGDVDAVWDGVPTLTTDRQIEGTDGARATVRVLWHGDRLDVLAEVADPRLDATSSNAWEQDSVEIFVDPVNAKAGPFNPADGQYRVNYLGVESISGDLATIGERLTSAAKVIDGGYVVEASIALGRTAQVGDLVGLELQVNDAADGARTAVRSWADPTGRSYQSTSRWGVATLATAPDPGPVDPGPGDPDPEDPKPVAPVVTTQPVSVTGALGRTVTLVAAATGEPAPAVQWEKRRATSTRWFPVRGATTPTLRIDVRTTPTVYRAVFTNKAGSAATAEATVSLRATAPRVTKHPRSVTAKKGRTVTLRAAASGEPRPTVRWQKRRAGSSTWHTVRGATRSTLKVKVRSTTIVYRAVFTNAAGKAVTRSAVVRHGVKPRIVSQPRSVTTRSRDSVRFSVKATGTPRPTVQWYQRAAGSQRWTAVKRGTGRTLTVKAPKRGSKVAFKAIVKNSAGKAVTRTAILRVR